MKKFGIVSYNIYCNFTNYGSALQSWALHQTVDRLGAGRWHSVLVDYCPDVLADKDPLNPFKNMWDQDAESKRMCELTMPAIRENYKKFDAFYHERFNRAAGKYTSSNFNDIVNDEGLDGFVCGSDTIFCMDEFGFDDGYYANYPVMKNGFSVAYAASFGDPTLSPENCAILNDRLQNFKAFGLREDQMIPYVREHTDVPVQRVVDPTLLLNAQDYDCITAQRQLKEPYLLLYSRRYDPEMEKYADILAKKHGWKIVEISLRATNADKHTMRYDAGVEEFLSLVKHAEYVVTNSYHGMIFSVQFSKPFVVFSRYQCSNKIAELLDLFGLRDRMLSNADCLMENDIDYSSVHKTIDLWRNTSLDFLEKMLNLTSAAKHS